MSQRAGEENPWNGGQGALADAFAPYSVGESVLVECYQPDASFSELPCQAELTLNALWTGEEALNYVREAGGDPTVLGPGEEFRVARFQIRLLKSAGNTAFFSSNNFWAADGRKAYENYNPAGGNPQLLSLRPEESEEITVCAVVQKESDALFYFFTTTGYVCFVSR